MTRPPLDRRALGRALSRLANATSAEAARAIAVEPHHAARRIGITGAPGAGKSTLAGRLAHARLGAAAGARRLGVLAIDPSSPRSGGAILGDRIRMDDLPRADEIYIRSLGSRSAADGLADNLPAILAEMDAHYFDEVLVETVGVGQAEHAVRAQVDTLVLVLSPDGGDAVQAMKAGITEMADIHVVNKSDQPAAAKIAAEVKRVLALAPVTADGWQPPVMLTSANDAASVAALSEAIDRHGAWLAAGGAGVERLVARRRYRLRGWFERRLREVVAGLAPAELEQPIGEQIETVLARIGPPGDR